VHRKESLMHKIRVRRFTSTSPSTHSHTPLWKWKKNK